MTDKTDEYVAALAFTALGPAGAAHFHEACLRARARALVTDAMEWAAAWSEQTAYGAVAIVSGDGVQRVNVMGPLSHAEAEKWLAETVAPDAAA